MSSVWCLLRRTLFTASRPSVACVSTKDHSHGEHDIKSLLEKLRKLCQSGKRTHNSYYWQNRWHRFSSSVERMYGRNSREEKHVLKSYDERARWGWNRSLSF
ncbi:hypothetical protein SLE2022_012760 [Rubroshorea leprosula]